MKPTEEQIQAELDRNGLGAWNIILGTHVLWLHPTNGRPSISIDRENGSVAISGTAGKVDVNVKDAELEELDSGALNYGFLSSWNVHVLPALRSIVRLITGEQTLEEKVREKLSGRKYVCLEVSTNEVSYRTNGILYVITNDKFKIWHEGKREPIVHDISVFMGLCAYGQDYRKMICDIAALLTPSDQPEQTLEEAVRGHIDCLEYMPAYSVHEDHAVIKYEPKGTYEIYADKVVVDCGPWSGEYLLDEFDDSTFNDDLREAVLNIAKLYSTRSTKPSYSDLEQRVEELDERLQEMTCWRDNLAKELHAQNRKVEELERENASVLDRFGPIDQAEQQYAVARKEFETFTEKVGRWAQGIIELNEEIL